MKRISKYLLCPVLLTLALSACGDAGEDAGTGPSSIRFSSHISGMDKVVEAFNTSQDDIVVTFEQTPSPTRGGNAKLSNGLKAGNAPDLATVEYQDLPSFVSQGGIRPVGDLAADVLKLVPEGILSSVTFAGQTWAVPYDAAPMVFYYRVDVYDELGLKAPQTWEDFRTTAETIATKKPGTAIASFWPNEPKLFAALAWQNGAHWFSTEGDAWRVRMTDAPTLQVAEFWQDLIDDKLVKVEQGFSDEWANSLGTGEVVGYVGASWGVGGLVSRTKSSAGKWKVAQLPSWGQPASSMYGGSTFVVTKDSKNPDAAARFAGWLATSKVGFEARGEVGVAYPAIPDLIPAAKKTVSTEHFGGQDIYAVFDQAASTIVKGWTWGPTLGTLTSLGDGLGLVGPAGSASITSAVQAAQKSTVDEMKGAGLTVVS